MLLPLHLHQQADTGRSDDHDAPLHGRDCVLPLTLSIAAALLALALLGADWRGTWLEPDTTFPPSTRSLVITPLPR